MRTPSRPTCRYTPRYRSIITALLTVLCVPVIFYHLVPSFTAATDSVFYQLSDHVLGQTSRGDFCTREIGDRQCCMLYLDASPCLDECRREHVDRETLRLTLEYDQCADQCLVRYNDRCESAQNGNPLDGHQRSP
ncbi:hypothetical protein BKA66DRAFT_429019 [Pyrenochaeta sp. MPI-SDFR-AT-0127]|nr:hypothetical protein BKA66DRAFT_429019 [Pyrenochaeta sp. MPI-SDFR-AT-0127]